MPGRGELCLLGSPLTPPVPPAAPAQPLLPRSPQLLLSAPHTRDAMNNKLERMGKDESMRGISCSTANSSRISDEWSQDETPLAALVAISRYAFILLSPLSVFAGSGGTGGVRRIPFVGA
ncbi:hypothetical protein Y032_0134g1871 [Ancylostoma ceylanicum]|nr:hypothetical protein Y032_0134g1871 [Ancylostoma ceylanicum]